jgi:hypothetical protein
VRLDGNTAVLDLVAKKKIPNVPAANSSRPVTLLTELSGSEIKSQARRQYIS